MKHRLFSFVILLAALAHPTLSRAYDFSAVAPSGQTLYYNIVGGEAQVTYQYYYSTSSYLTGDLTIPSSVTHAGTTYSVTSIGENAFKYCGLTSVTIPNSVTSIGSLAFCFCSNLTSVTIPESVTYLGENAFVNCNNLSTVNFNAIWCETSDMINANPPFSQNHNITIFNFGNNCRRIPRRLCKGMMALTSVTIPNSVTSIGDYAFSGCSGLTSVTIGNSVTSIGGGAFYSCRGLTSVTIPNSVTSIGGGAFIRCDNLTSLTLMCQESPAIGADVFGQYNSYNSNMLINIPCGSWDSYYNGFGWSYYRSLLREPVVEGVSIEVSSYRDNFGSTNIIARHNGIQVLCDSSTVIGANASYGYHFSHWSNGSTSNPDTLHLTGDSTVMAYFIGLTATTSDETQGTATHHMIGDKWEMISASPRYGYHFSHWSNGSTANPDTLHLTGDSTVTAYFDRNTYTVSTFSNDDALGYACGDVEGLYLDTIELSATCTAEHYHFSRWSDGNTDNPRQYVVEGNRTLTALFAIDTHTVRVTCDVARGTVSGGGRFTYGSACTVEAQEPYTGFVFHSWSNGVTANPYVFAVIGDIELSAIFVAEGEEVYTVTVASADPEMGFVGGGGQALASGRLTIRAQGYPGYHFLRWNDNNTDSVRTVTVTGNATYTAYFSETVGIEDVAEGERMQVWVSDGRIHVRTHGREAVGGFEVYDVMGRLVAAVAAGRDACVPVPAGVYLVRVAGLPARKVVVMR